MEMTWTKGRLYAIRRDNWTVGREMKPPPTRDGGWRSGGGRGREEEAGRFPRNSTLDAVDKIRCPGNRSVNCLTSSPIGLYDTGIRGSWSVETLGKQNKRCRGVFPCQRFAGWVGDAACMIITRSCWLSLIHLVGPAGDPRPRRAERRRECGQRVPGGPVHAWTLGIAPLTRNACWVALPFPECVPTIPRVQRCQRVP